MHRTIIETYKENRDELEQRRLTLQRQLTEQQRWLTSLQQEAARPGDAVETARLRLELEDADKAVSETQNDIDTTRAELQHVKDKFLEQIDSMANGNTTRSEKDQFTLHMLADMNETLLDTRHRVLATEQRTGDIWQSLSSRVDDLESNHVHHLESDVIWIQNMIAYWTEPTTVIGIIFMLVLLFGSFYAWALKEFRDGVWIAHELSIPATILALSLAVYLGASTLAGHRRIK